MGIVEGSRDGRPAQGAPLAAAGMPAAVVLLLGMVGGVALAVADLVGSASLDLCGLATVLLAAVGCGLLSARTTRRRDGERVTAAEDSIRTFFRVLRMLLF